MSNTIHCRYFNEEKEALPFAPFPGPAGEQIQQTISKEAWQLWLKHQTLLINEKQLNLMDEKSQTYLAEQREHFFNRGTLDKIEGYTPPE